MTPAALLSVCSFLAVSVVSVPALAQQNVQTPPSARSRVVWEHDGEGVEWFEVRVDGTTVVTAGLADRESGTVFSVPTPLMFPGLHQIVVAACNASGCASSEPLIVRAVSAPIRWPKTGELPDGAD